MSSGRPPAGGEGARRDPPPAPLLHVSEEVILSDVETTISRRSDVAQASTPISANVPGNYSDYPPSPNSADEHGMSGTEAADDEASLSELSVGTEDTGFHYNPSEATGGAMGAGSAAMMELTAVSHYGPGEGKGEMKETSGPSRKLSGRVIKTSRRGSA
eukprot:CAMPEP_0118877816 /NCGR_PEP_ID=MMETSP1163-20130328/17971_1 /TAXON_ID=124430 /ORGANISM="Phaeomonas parva, Strain CCMP2877" /LENGTH=158 /DNA_ID=CAMNT_0006813571 /DNA_START=267 /DNA_END=739 /DNA_ORIENTATION=-